LCRDYRSIFHGENLGYIAGWLCFNLRHVGSVVFRALSVDVQELRFEAVDDLNKFMNLDELEESFSDKRVKFAVEKGEI